MARLISKSHIFLLAGNRESIEIKSMFFRIMALARAALAWERFILKDVATFTKYAKVRQ